MTAPAVFISHGSPMTALDSGPFSQALKRFGAKNQPRAIIVVSGHWEAKPPVRVSSSAAPPMIYDFGGFPPELSAVKYPAPGDPALAYLIIGLLKQAGIDATADETRGFDHGTWAPLRLLYPDATIPVVQISQPQHRSPESLFAVGQALAPLLSENIMILGSGGITHNLFLRRPASLDASPEPWAVQFDNWFEKALADHDIDALLHYAERAPHSRQAVPTPEHFDPLFVVLGAAGNYSVETIYEGFQMSHFSLRSFALK